ncbi:MAG: hypothetical protein ACPHCN_06535 [Mycobacterium sp.]
MNEANNALLERLREEHGGPNKVSFAELPCGTLVAVRTPKRAIWKTTVDKLAREKGEPDSTQYNLVRQCLAAPIKGDDLEPDREAFAALVEEYPGLVQAMFDGASKLARGGIQLDLTGN